MPVPSLSVTKLHAMRLQGSVGLWGGAESIEDPYSDLSDALSSTRYVTPALLGKSTRPT